jgi:transcriptional regulator with XRE-family HTH domain
MLTMARTNTRIKELRQQRKLSLGQLAMRVGVHRSYIHKIEQGLQMPTVKVLARLARYLECPMEELIEIQAEVKG